MEKKHYDILLLDLIMPVMDGYQTFRYLNDCTDIKPQYTIALTGNVLPKDKKTCLDLGMDYYITKPIDIVLLGNILKTCVNQLNVDAP
jgi:CheY-like chemotaxis protein